VNIPVIYEDEWLLVLNKPSGLLTIATWRNERRTLSSILNADAREKGLAYRLHPCHRLDRETSGLIIYAKGKSIQKKMMWLFKERKIKKAYIAFVQGVLPKEQGEIRDRIEGLSALTRYRTVEKRKDFSVVEVQPFTGRTNQIRIHFKNQGCPILGDTKYAFRRDFKLKAKRLLLHAKSAEFIHPVDGRHISLTVDLPVEMKEFLIKNG